jgi:hypothetical protein
MQAVSSSFTTRAAASIRHLAFALQISFAKDFNDAIDFFTIGTSLIGGSDIIRGEGLIIQEWDKYTYPDYSDRVISMEWSREEETLSSVANAIADVTLDNHDDYFTPGGVSAIAAYILPYRPIKLFMGFGSEVCPQFVGLTQKMPTINEKTKQVTFHCVDFLFSLLSRPLDQAVILQNKRTDEALASLMTLVGLSATQYDFDTGYNVIDFVFFPSGTKLGDAIQQLMVPEMGRFYMDELGMLRFKNRQNYSATAIATFDDSNIIDITTRKDDDIVNVVEVIANVREVVSSTDIYKLPKPVLIPAGDAVDIWADFKDPATTVDTPVYYLSSTSSYFQTNYAADGTGGEVATDIVVSSATLYGPSYKMTFQNNGVVDAYVTNIQLFGTPAQVVKEIYVREQDDTSVAKYDERVYTIKNDFFADETTAQSKALIMLDDLAEYGGINEMTVKGNPALQIGDPIAVTKVGYEGTYTITKITNRLLQPAAYTQTLKIKRKTVRTFFTIGESTIGGADVIAP